MDEIKLIVTEEFNNVRLDKYISLCVPDKTRSFLTNLIEKDKVFVNGCVCKKNYKVSCGDCIHVVIPEPVSYEAKPENIPLTIMYEDDDLLIVNKPKGMVVHPAVGNYNGTLVNALLYHCKDSLSGINGVIRPGIVHRIDKDTSGLLIVAKNDISHRSLAQQIKEHSFTREYEAVVFGNIKDEIGTINAPIGRHPIDRKKMTITNKNARNAITHFEVLARYSGHTHIRCILETGRTHQIRVHMAYIGHSVCGDNVYGCKSKEKFNFVGQCLHARKIGFVHPSSGEYMEFESELPKYFSDYLQKLKKLS